MNQRMFHGHINAFVLADQLGARFSNRKYRSVIQRSSGRCLVQIGSKHGTPVSVHIVDTIGGVLVSMGNDRDWLDKIADGSEMTERAAQGNLISVLAIIPDVIGEINKDNLTPKIWTAINELCALTRALAGEENGLKSPLICLYCQTPNPAVHPTAWPAAAPCR